jgi:hypothetical protein
VTPLGCSLNDAAFNSPCDVAHDDRTGFMCERRAAASAAPEG